MKARLLLATLFACIVGCDQVTKGAVTTLPRGGIEVIPGFFRLIYAQNPGVAFSGFVSLPDSYRAPLLSLLGTVLLAFVLVTLFRTPASQTWNRVGYALIAAGAVGNLADRMRLGYVVDFIQWHIRDSYSWPVFNVADAALVVGIGILLLAPKPAPSAV